MATLVQQHKGIFIICVVLVLLFGFVVFEVLSVVYGGTSVPTPTIPREPIVQGSGPALKYVVMGDSSAVAQGADYSEGYAIATTDHLAKNYTVTMLNVGVSGARAKDMTGEQLEKAQAQKPDVVLIAVGGNDVTHLSSAKSVEQSIKTAVNQLIQTNCDLKIVVTGVPQMGSVPRFPQPLQAVAGLRTTQLNKVFDQLVNAQSLTFARIAEQTGRQFKDDPTLFAQDKFHPNARGYAVWTPVLNQALDAALTSQPSHCPKD